MWFFYLELYQHGVGVYSYNCNMELNANLAPPQQDAMILRSLWGGVLETAPHKADGVWWGTKLWLRSCSEDGWRECHAR